MQQLTRLGLANVRLIAMDAADVLDLLTDRSLDEIHLYFPDPWPKRRQQKRRLVKPEFLRVANRVLGAGGRLHIATDWLDYATAIAAIGNEAHGFLNLAGERVYAPRPKSRPITRYEARAERLGHTVFEFLLAPLPQR
jgi:tRNA (guanine-N7-)-methyltransferase